MMKSYLIFLIGMTVALFSCQPEKAEPTVEPDSDKTEKPFEHDEIIIDDEVSVNDGETEGEVERENPYLIEKKDLSELEYLMSFIPDNHLVLDYEYGDLNKDGLKKDVILIAYQPDLERNREDDVKRPLFILTRTSDGKLKKEARNDNVALCSTCGGVMGDPYQDIAIKNGYFSIEHYGGSSWRWTRIITFKYDEGGKGWLLHKDGGLEYHASNPDDSKETVKTSKDFGIVPFGDYKG